MLRDENDVALYWFKKFSMPTQFKIAITKEVIAQCINCGIEGDNRLVENNCAIAMALSDIFPDVYVTNRYIFPFGIDHEKKLQIPIPIIAEQFIKLFDGFKLTPRLRLLLPEFEFMIDIPDEVIEQINIDDVRLFIENSNKYHSKVNSNFFSNPRFLHRKVKKGVS